jgi:mannose-6-phosphate isomerase-like protein (cupin superfamily)
VYISPPIYPCSSCVDTSMCSQIKKCPFYKMCCCPYYSFMPMFSPVLFNKSSYNNIPNKDQARIKLMDYGPSPFVVDINQAAKQNKYFRIALWTGTHLQLTLMSIDVGEDIGLESHPHLDQFIRIEHGQGLVMMGDSPKRLDFRAQVRDDYAFIIPAGKWHNLINTGCVPLKLYSIYAPPQHPFGTVQKTKEDAEENHWGYYQKDY